jgi:hypothetical protein
VPRNNVNNKNMATVRNFEVTSVKIQTENLYTNLKTYTDEYN